MMHVMERPSVWQRMRPALSVLDTALTCGVLALCGFGLVIMYSAGYDFGSRFTEHARNMALAFIIMFLVAQVSPQRLMQVAVPIYTVVIRKCYGMAGMGTTDKNGLDLKIAWPSAEWGSLPIEGGVAAAFRKDIASAADPRAREREIEADLRSLASPYRTAEAFGVEEIIDPRELRSGS